MTVLDLRERQLETSAHSIQDIDVTPDEGGRIVARLRAFGPFAPAIFDEARATIEVSGPNGVERALATMRLRPSISPRGTWFTYELVFDGPGEAERITFHGLNSFSNVRRLVLQSDGRPTVTIQNRFFRA